MISKPELSASLRPTIGALAAVIFLLPSGLAHAQSDETCTNLLLMEAAQLAVTTEVALEIKDQVSDGCWARPEAARNVVELELLNSGVSTVESGFKPRLVIHSLGYQLDDYSCAVVVSLYLFKPLASYVPFSATHPEGDLLLNFSEYEIWSKMSLMTGPKSDMQNRIKNYFEEAAEALVLDYRKAQTTLFKTCPRMRAPIEKATSNTE